MSIKHLYEDERPALLLDFANSKTIDPRITFTRNSTATYVDELGVIKTAAAGEGRIDHDPATGECLGFLLEESRTNIFFPSIIPTTSSNSWVIDGASLTANAGLAPDGANTATLYDHSASTGNSRFYTFTGGTIRNEAYSFFIKDGGGAGIFKFQFQSGFGTGGAAGLCEFDFSTNTLGGAFPTSSPEKIQASPLANGWFRITATNNVTVTGLTSGVLVFGGSSSTGNTLVWGFQREGATTFSTSYIPTSGSTVTRNGDEAEITGTDFSSWYNQSEGTLFVQGTMPHNNPSGYPSVYTIRTNLTNSNEIDLTRAHNNKNLKIYLHSGNSLEYAAGIDPLPDNYKVAVGYKANNFNSAGNGTLGTLDTSGAVPVGPDRFLIDNANTQHHISRISYYPTRLSDSTLEALTK